MPRHIVLLGDSIFDNGAYTGGAPDVVTHLQRQLPAGWRATSRAQDGATCRRLPEQIRRVPPDASHLAMAVGGNDALQNSDLLSLSVASSADALARFAERLDVFAREYGAAVDAAHSTGLPLVVCTIYNGALPPEQARVASVALATFNDVILRTAAARRIDVIELRTICTEPGDYANPIEPSGQGGAKIAGIVARALGALGSTPSPSRLWAG